jgi:hypothetical protein
MLTKESVNESLNQLSDSFTIDELIDKLIFVEKVKNGIKQSSENKVISREQAKEKLAKWLN